MVVLYIDRVEGTKATFIDAYTSKNNNNNNNQKRKRNENRIEVSVCK